MEKSTKSFKPNETTKLLDSLSMFLYLCWLPLFWDNNVSLSTKFMKVYDKVTIVVVAVFFIFTFSAVCSLFTQENLTARQAYDRSFLMIVTPFLKLFYVTLLYNKTKIEDVLYHLAVVLREHYNDLELERKMTRKIRLISTTFTIASMCIIAGNGLIGILKVVIAGENFCPVVPAWPDIADTSPVSLCMRVILYVIWWMYSIWAMAMLILLLTMFITIFYQFKNLQSYFYSIEDIFRNDSLSHEEKEMKYEQSFKLGIHMHALTLWCRSQHQDICEWIFGAEIMLTVIVLMANLTSLMCGKHDVSTLTSMLPVMIITLVNLALFMWHGGDITIEASKVSEAMYFSGWENCSRRSSARVRKLVACAIRQAQEPVVYKTLGVVEFSYESYVQIAKLPYSVVSMFY